MIDDRYREEVDEKAAQSTAMMLSLRDAVVAVLLIGFRFWWLVLPLFLLVSSYGAYRLLMLVPQIDVAVMETNDRTLTVVVESGSSAVTREILNGLRQRISSVPGVNVSGDSLRPLSLSGTVLWPLGDDLEKGADLVIGMQPFLARLSRSSEGGVNGTAYLQALGQTLEDDSLGSPSGALPAIKALDLALSSTSGSTVSWSGLIRQRTVQKSGVGALYLTAGDDLGGSIAALQSVLTGLIEQYGASLTLTGGALWALQEEDLIWQRIWLSLIVLVFGFGLLAYFAFHRVRTVLTLGILMFVWTGLQGLWIEPQDVAALSGLFGLALGVIVLLIASVDVFDRFLDAESQSRDVGEAAKQALQERIGAFSLVFLSLPIALLGFLLFAWGDLALFAQNAWQSVLFSGIALFLFLPALLRVLGRAEKRISVSPMRLFWAGVAGMTFSFGRTVIVVTVLLIAFGIGATPFFKPLFGQAERLSGEPSVLAHQAMLNMGIGSPWNLVGRVDEERTAASLATRLAGIPQVREVIWAGSLISPVGSRERALLNDMQMLMGLDQSSTRQLGPVSASSFDPESWSGLRTALLSIETHWTEAKSLHEASVALLGKMTEFEDRFADGGAERESAWSDVERALLRGLPEFWRSVEREINESPPSRREASQALEGSWVSRTSGYRIEVVPDFDIDDDSARGEFVRAVGNLLPRGEGFLMQEYEWRETLLAMLSKAVGASLLLMAFFASLFGCRRAPSVGMVLIGGVAMLVAVGIASANGWHIPGDWVGLIPAIGLLTIATGIFTLHRITLYSPAMGNLMLSSTGRGVILGWALILVIGAALMMSAHPAVSGAGRLLVIGSMVGPFFSLVLVTSIYAPRYSVSET